MNNNEAAKVTTKTISAVLQDYAVLVNGETIGTVSKFGALWEARTVAGQTFAATSRKAAIAKMTR